MCISCKHNFHPRCFKGLLSEKYCFDCLPEAAENIQDEEIKRNCPELEALLKSKGLSILHLNIRRLENNLSKLNELFFSF